MNIQTGELRGKHFVGRKNAFRVFDQFLINNEKRIFLITGPGGIGKTWLLGELKKHAQRKNKDSISVTTEVTDLISTKYHRISNLWSRIIELSGHSESFKEHSQEYDELQRLREENQSFSHAERALQDKSFSLLLGRLHSSGKLLLPTPYLGNYPRLHPTYWGN